MTDELRFVTEPPPTGMPRRDWESVAAGLRKNPGEWAEFLGVPISVPIILRQGVKALPSDEFEVITRNTDKQARTCDVYIRYQPEEKA